MIHGVKFKALSGCLEMYWMYWIGCTEGVISNVWFWNQSVYSVKEIEPANAALSRATRSVRNVAMFVYNMHYN